MDDKTTKIPSLKEFQNSNEKVKTASRKSGKKTSAKGFAHADTHRVDIDNKRISSQNRTADKYDNKRVERPENKRGSLVSGSTRKIDSTEVRRIVDEWEYREKKVQSRNNGQGSHSSDSLKQKKTAGQRPPQPRGNLQRTSQQRPPQQRVPQQRTTQQRSATQSEYIRNSSQQRPPYKGKSQAQRDEYRRGSSHPAGRSQNTKPVPKSAKTRAKKHKKPLSPFVRKVRRILWYVLIVLGILALGAVLSLTVLFKTENINVNMPDGMYSSRDIIEASGLRYEENIFTANKTAAENRLEEKFPYIKSAEITARIPDTININITLSSPVYAVKGDKLTYLANEDSKVLEVIATADEVDVPVIEGVTVKDTKAGGILEFDSEIVKTTLSEMFRFAVQMGYKNITRVDIGSQTNAAGVETIDLKYVYDDRIVVYMGLPENISYKMQTAQKIITDKLDVNNTVLTGELDVSMCYETKKSYFNQYTLIPDVVITEPATEVTTVFPEE